MHDARNRMALHSGGQPPGSAGANSGDIAGIDPALRRLLRPWLNDLVPTAPAAEAPGSPFMLRESIAPRFPEDVLIAPPSLPGPLIVSLNVSGPDMASLKPAAANVSKPKLGRAKISKAKITKAKPKAKANPRKQTKAKAVVKTAASAPVMPPPPMPGPAPYMPLPAAIPDDRTPFAPLPRGQSLAAVEQGLVARLVSWLSGLSAKLPRKRRRAVLPKSRQTRAQQAAPSELAALRRENERLRQQLARLSADKKSPAVGGRPPG